MLLDVGPGSVHGLARLGKPWWAVSHVVLSHYHTDHIGDLAHLLFALRWAPPEPRSDPLDVIGPPGLQDLIEHLAAAHGPFFREQSFPLRYTEQPRRGSWHAPGDVTVSFHPTPHTEESVAMRVEGAGWTLGYTGDTGPDEDVGDFLAGSDVLICECGYGDPPPAPHHLSPRGVAALARAANPGLLVLTHVYPPLRPQDAPGEVAGAGYGGRVVAAEDGLALSLGADPASEAGSMIGR